MEIKNFGYAVIDDFTSAMSRKTGHPSLRDILWTMQRIHFYLHSGDTSILDTDTKNQLSHIPSTKF